MKKVNLKQKLTRLYKIKLKGFLKFFLLVFIMGVFSPQNIYAQINCAAQDNLSIEELNEIKDNILRLSRKSSASARTTTTYQIPLQFVIVNNGSTPPAPGNIVESLPGKVNEVNSVFTNDMEFFICGVEEISSSIYYDFLPGTDPTDLYNLFHVDDAINVYIVNSFGDNDIGGFSSVNASDNRVFVKGELSGYVLAHELGHFFDLLHTHKTQIATVIASDGRDSLIEVVPLPSEPCDGGDYICDTPTDPGPKNCTSSCSAGNCNFNGYIYSPDRQNVMSYYSEVCGSHFSADQLTVMQNNLLTEPNKAYLLTAPTSCVPFLIADRGYIEKIDDITGNNIIKMRFVQVSIEDNGNLCTKRSSQHAPDYSYNPRICNYLLPQTNTVTVKPFTDDASNEDFAVHSGVTALDLTFISQHNLGTNLFTSPYSWIAADANGNGNITAYDQLLVQRVILAVDPTFAATGSWRYVPNKYLLDSSFKNSFDVNPFGASINGRTYTSTPSYLNEMDIDLSDNTASDKNSWSLKAIKMGDVNFSTDLAQENNFTSNPIAASRNNETSKLVYRVEMRGRNCIEEGEEFILEIRGETDIDIAAYQLGFSFDKEALAISGVQKSGFGEFDIENFGLTKLDRGELRTLWFDEKGRNLKISGNNRKLFKLKLKALKSICNLEETIKLDDTVLENFFVNENGRFIESSLVFEVKSAGNKKEGLRVGNNKVLNIYPNPSNSNSDLSFEFQLENRQKVQITVTDQYGNSISKEAFFSNGINQISLDNAGKLNSGPLFYRVIIDKEIINGTIIKH